MLSARRKADGQTVSAYFESKANAPFFCLTCGDEVVLKAGRNRTNHFAHANPLACEYAQGESDEHRRCKTEIYEALLRDQQVSDVVLERPLGPVRPDISAYIKGVPVAIEVQISNLSLDTIMRRTIDYHRKGIYVLWLLLWTPKLDNRRYSPKKWEKWLHTCYFGQVYYWLGGLDVVSYHFEPSLRSVQPSSWYATGGRKTTSRGYTRRLKQSRTAVRGKVLDLVNDFGPRERMWWEGGGLKVPDAKLFIARDSRMR